MAVRGAEVFLLLLVGASGVGASALCSGIEKKFPRSGSVVCCPAGCGVCGGSKCSKAPVPNAQTSCCPGPIVRAGRQCEANDAGPCLIKKAGDPTCSTGVIHADGMHCFPAECGAKAGVDPDCADAPGGRKSCCMPSRRKAADAPRECSKVDPPCVLASKGGAASSPARTTGAASPGARPSAVEGRPAAVSPAAESDGSSAAMVLVVICAILAVLVVCTACVVVLLR